MDTESKYISDLCIDRFSPLALHFEGVLISELDILAKDNIFFYDELYDMVPKQKRLLLFIFYKEVLSKYINSR